MVPTVNMLCRMYSQNNTVYAIISIYVLRQRRVIDVVTVDTEIQRNFWRKGVPQVRTSMSNTDKW